MHADPLYCRRILITGGTGSLGKILTRRILQNELGAPEEIVIFSRDEAKQHNMRLWLGGTSNAGFVQCGETRVRFVIGDIRDQAAISRALQSVNIVFSAAALKQVPSCEYNPYEAVLTNVGGVQNIVRTIAAENRPVTTVVGISTDKAVKPVNVMGMTKAIQERVVQAANLFLQNTRCIAVRYGNVLASRGSVIPLFHEQIRAGGPVTVTHEAMTRFLLPLDEAVNTVFAALLGAEPGETYIPKAPSARIVDVVAALIGDRKIDVKITGIRPGEKIHEILISEEELWRTEDRGNYFAIRSVIPEVSRTPLRDSPLLPGEFSSANAVMPSTEVRSFLERHGCLVEGVTAEPIEELLR